MRRMTVTIASAAIAWFALSVGGCSRHRQEAVILANEGDQNVELDPDLAISKYEQATKLDPQNHKIFYKLAKAYKKKEAWDKVASTLGRATEVAPTFANYWFERGNALYQQAKKGTIQYKEALEPLNKCVEADQGYDECYYLLARCHYWSDDEQKSIDNYTKAIEHRPDRIDYYEELADLYWRLGLYKEAEDVGKAAKTIAKPGDKRLFGIHVVLSEIHKTKGNMNEVVAELEQAKAFQEEHPEVLFNLGSTYATLEPPRKQEALQMLKGFASRACKGKQAQTIYRDQCEQAQTLQQEMQGSGG